MKEATITLPRVSKTQTISRALQIPWYVYLVSVASTSIVIGLLWDISWHMSIGRDAFLSPPHVAIYLGGLLAGFGGGYLMMKTTFFATPEEKARSVWFWGFRSPLGALLLVWGALAMLTSAPFDDWWHNAYGLDVKILSPPHALLALGITVIQLGAVISLLTYQNHQEQIKANQDFVHIQRLKIVRFMYTYTVAMLISVVAIALAEYFRDRLMHSSIYYQVACIAFPIFLVAAGRASDMRWPITSAAGVYMAIFLFMVWFLPLFPATPRLGPVLNKVTHFVPFKFPLLLIVPAIFTDIVMRKTGHLNGWLATFWISLTFFGGLFLSQWSYGYFAISPYSENWIFAGHIEPYYARPDHPLKYTFHDWDPTTGALIKGLGIAFVFCFISTRLGLWWGNWMRKVQR